MTISWFKHILIAVLLFLVATCQAQEYIVDRQVMVAMRMIGHQVLLDAGDSTSLVLPIEKVEDRYRISFSTEFQFEPDRLVATIDGVVKATNLAERYIVEVENCDTSSVVYAYAIGKTDSTDVLACGTRELPSACYVLFISILDTPETAVPLQNFPYGPTDNSAAEGGGKTAYMIGLFLVPFSALLALLLFLKRRKQNSVEKKNGILIGEYRFDKRNMMLSIQDQRVELTGKEADLLYLLHSSANHTVEREVMLREVWGDEGDYVGRTLDVFISKLRKKLEADPSVKIANIRGVGYRLVLNN